MTHRENPEKEDASLGQLTSELSQQVTRLVRDEIHLAQVEMRDKGKRLGTGAGLMGSGGVIGLFGFGCFVAAAVLAVNLALSAWLSAVIVGAALLVVAVILGLVGRRQTRRGTPPIPHEAIESAKEDLGALRGHRGE
jgi:Flp pilus assembly protein TadB